MNQILKTSGDLAAILGVAICLVAGVMRLAGQHHIVGIEAITLFTGGIALMVMGCLAKLHNLQS